MSATNLLVQEIKRLRAENNSLSNQLREYDRASKHVLNEVRHTDRGEERDKEAERH